MKKIEKSISHMYHVDNMAYLNWKVVFCKKCDSETFNSYREKAKIVGIM